MNLGAHSYPITVEEGALAQVGSCFSLRRRVLILTDSGVPAAYAQAVADACAEPHLVTLEPGEANKCPDTWLSVLRIMLKAGFDRGDALVAVGGGVIGDLGDLYARDRLLQPADHPACHGGFLGRGQGRRGP